MNALWSIRGRLLIFGLCISLIPIIIISVTAYFNARRIIKKQTLDWLRAVAESRKIHLLEFMEGRKQQVINFSSDGFIRDQLEKINRRDFSIRDKVTALNRHLLENKMPLDPYLVAITLVDMDGRVVASTNETAIGLDMSDQEVFVQTAGRSYNEPYVGRIRYSPYLDADCIFISAPITSRRGTDTIGAIINAYDVAALSGITTNRAPLACY